MVNVLQMKVVYIRTSYLPASADGQEHGCFNQALLDQTLSDGKDMIGRSYAAVWKNWILPWKAIADGVLCKADSYEALKRFYRL
ncbi:MAG: hypothetical protein ACLUI7_03175 [Coprococcus sp.]